MFERDVLISPAFNPANPFSWDTRQVYASGALVHDCAERIARTAWASKPSARMLLWEFYNEYGSAPAFDAFALGFNSGEPYRIVCLRTEYKNEELPESITSEDMRALCLIKIRLDVPRLVLL